MNLRYAECIFAVIKAGSITAASKTLYMSQSALSQTLQRAEKMLGAEIFDRSTEPISLTYAGERYVHAMSQVMAISTDLQNEINEINLEFQGRMRLGISLQRGMQLLPLIIPDFVRCYPLVRIELTERGSDTLERMLHEGICDLALITTDPKYPDLVYELLETEEVVLVCAKTFPLAQRFEEGAEIDIRETQGERFVALKHGHSVREVQEDLFRSRNFHPEVLLETDSLEAAKRVAAGGAALMLCPNVYVEQSPDVRQKVKCFRIKGIDYRRHFYLSYRRDMYLPRFMVDFGDIIKRKLHPERIKEGLT